jgi:sensor histidine kinase regulating citrate/malate metabolism
MPHQQKKKLSPFLDSSHEQIPTELHYGQPKIIISIIIILTGNGFVSGGSVTTVRHNTQITHITQNNTPHSN